MLAEFAATFETLAGRPHYIVHRGRYLFAWHHPAQPAMRRGAAVVLCPPLGSDYIGVYRVWRTLAQRLAGIGFDVLRFDYEGTGDSEGDAEGPGRLKAWIGDIERVVKEARELTGSSEVALVGLRIGATLALHAAAASGGVDRLVLWSPFSSGRAYVRELRAFSRLSRKDYVTEIDQGPDILAAGYILPGAVVQELEGLDLNALSNCPAPHVLLVDRDDRSPDRAVGERLESLGASIARVRPAGTAEMLERPAASKVPEAALDAIADWLEDWPLPRRPGAGAEAAAAGRHDVAHASDHLEHAVRFGPSDRLFGILTIPKDASRAAPAVIFLNTGFEYRVGPHRHYVPLARELAAQGHVVLRYDLGGVGDSLAPPGAPDNVAYPAHALEDAREAIAFVRKQAPGRPLILAGLCSGGWHAFRIAREGLAVDAIVCVNAPLYLRDGLARMTRRSLEYREMLGYRRMLRDRDRWANALRGRSHYIYFARFATAYLVRKMWDRVEPLFATRLRDGLARDLDGVCARGITSLFVFSQGDLGLDYFDRYATPALRRWRACGRIHRVVVEGAGHSFTPPEAQHALRELLLDFVTKQLPPESPDMKSVASEPRLVANQGSPRGR